MAQSKREAMSESMTGGDMAQSKRGEGDKAESMLGVWLSQRGERGIRLSQCWGYG